MPESPEYVGGHGLLAGKTVVVTAAAGTGIGSAVARKAIEEGATVMISDFHERRLGETADRLAEETGTRHRTADRVSKQVGFPVVSVSQSMRLIALYVDGQRRVLEDSAAILSRANQALATLERYKLRLDEVAGTLSALEIEDLVTVRDVAAVAQRLEMVRRISEEIDAYVLELGF